VAGEREPRREAEPEQERRPQQRAPLREPREEQQRRDEREPELHGGERRAEARAAGDRRQVAVEEVDERELERVLGSQ